MARVRRFLPGLDAILSLQALVDKIAPEDLETALAIIKRRVLAVRFWKNVRKDANGCWIWTRAINKSNGGYGAFRVGGGSRKANRVAWELARGPIPSGLLVLHRCDVRACVNPEHLFLGTNADNTRDMISKGRKRDTRGEERHNAVLDDEKVREIRRRRAAGESFVALAKEFGVTAVTIGSIARGESWTHIM